MEEKPSVIVRVLGAPFCAVMACAFIAAAVVESVVAMYPWSDGPRWQWWSKFWSWFDRMPDTPITWGYLFNVLFWIYAVEFLIEFWPALTLAAAAAWFVVEVRLGL